MESIYNSFSGVIPGVPGALLFWLVVVAAIALIVFSFKMTAHNTDPTTKGVSKAIKKLGAETVSDIMIADDVEGPIHIEHLCLTPSGIAVVDVKDYRGYLFGGAKTDQWTQVIDSRSYRFENPLHRNKDRVRAIEAMVDDVPIYGCVVFTNAGSFPKDKPEGVVMQDHLHEGLGLNAKATDVPPRYVNAWQDLIQQLQSDNHAVVVEQS